MLDIFFSVLADSKTAVIITSPENRRYFTGFNSTDGFLVITKDEATFFTDSRYIEAAQKQISLCKAVLLKSAEETMVPFLKEKGVEKILLETDRMTVGFLNKLKKLFDFCEVDANEVVDSLVDKLRETKTEKEIE